MKKIILLLIMLCLLSSCFLSKKENNEVVNNDTDENETIEVKDDFGVIDGEIVDDSMEIVKTTTNTNNQSNNNTKTNTNTSSNNNSSSNTGGNDKTPGHTHTIVVDPAVPATCEEDGKTEGKHCSTCNEIIVPQEKIEKLGHSYDKDKKCIRCGKEADDEAQDIVLPPIPIA